MPDIHPRMVAGDKYKEEMIMKESGHQFIHRRPPVPGVAEGKKVITRLGQGSVVTKDPYFQICSCGRKPSPVDQWDSR